MKGFPSFDRRTASQQGPPRRAFLKPRKPNVEPRLVGEIGAAPDEDHVRMRPLQMDMPPGIFASDPLRFARWKRDLAVDRQRELQSDPRSTQPEARQIAGERSRCRLLSSPELHLDTRPPEPLDPLARRARVRILERDYHLRGFRMDQQPRAGGAAFAFVRAGLERDIDGRSLRSLARLLERDRLGMRAPACRGRAFAHDLAVRRDDGAADIGIGRRRSARLSAKCDRLGHEARVAAHFIPSFFSSSWNCRCFSAW